MVDFDLTTRMRGAKMANSILGGNSRGTRRRPVLLSSRITMRDRKFLAVATIRAGQPEVVSLFCFTTFIFGDRTQTIPPGLPGGC